MDHIYILKKAAIYLINKKNIINVFNRVKCRNKKRLAKDNKPFIDKCNWEGINVTSEKEDWKNIEKNNLMIALNILSKKIYPIYVSKHNSNCKKHVNLLMISNGE